MESRTGSIVGALVVIAVGVAFLLDELGLWELDWGRVWPVALIAVGVGMLANAVARRKDA